MPPCRLRQLSFEQPGPQRLGRRCLCFAPGAAPVLALLIACYKLFPSSLQPPVCNRVLSAAKYTRTAEVQAEPLHLRATGNAPYEPAPGRDRKSTRLNSSHLVISYAVFCLKKKKNKPTSR